MALTDGLISYWAFDESSGDASDSSGNGKTLTNVNTVAYATGKINNGADFESSSSQYFSRSNDVYDITEGTVNFWVKMESFANSRYIITTAPNNTTKGFFVDTRLTGPTEGLRFGFGAGNQLVSSTNNAISTGTWYMVTCTWNTLRKEMFINAVSNAANETDETLTAGGTTLYVGRYEPSAIDYMDGMLDEMGVWNRVLSGTEITDLYNGGNGLAYPLTVASTNNNLTLLGVS